MKAPARIAVTGAAGQISYSLLFRLAAGDLLGLDQPIVLHLLDIPEAEDALKGVVMELRDCASPLLRGIVSSSDPDEAFAGVDYAFLIGAKPRGAGMERKDLLETNAKIFSVQGKALNRQASRSVKVLVVGNPANTNALITMKNAPDLDPGCFSAMMRLDHNRALAQLAGHCGVLTSDIQRLTIWGNHSTTQYPDLYHATICGEEALKRVDSGWYLEEFIPLVQQRGAAVIRQRGKSSAASAASAIIDHMGDWCFGTRKNDWISMAIASDGSYGITEGLVYSFPVAIRGGQCHIVQGLEINDFSFERMRLSEDELKQERDAIRHLL